MDTRVTHQQKLATALLAVSLTLSALPAQAQAQESQNALTSRVSSPQSGVKLLDELFQRVRSAPQVAMAKNLKQQQESQTIAKGGPTDYNLAIRPKQTGKLALMPEPTVALVPQSLPPVALGKTAGQPGDNLYIPPQSQVAPPPPLAQVESWYGNRQLATVPSAGGMQAGTLTGAQPERPGLWENSVAWDRSSNAPMQASKSRAYKLDTEASINSRARAKSTWYMSPRETQITDDRPVVRDFRDAATTMDNGLQAGAAGGTVTVAQSAPSMNTSTAGSMSVKGKMLNRVAMEPTAPAAAPAAAAAGRPPDIATATSRLANLAKQLQAVQQNADSFKEEDLKSMLRSQPEKKADMTAYRTAQPFNKMKVASKDAAAAMDKLSDNESELRYDSDKQERAQKLHARRKDTRLAWMEGGGIASLPPNVVTGIPLVRLGISETQANGALHTVGTTQQEKVEKWTVLSWHHSKSLNQTALQLYMRNGLLDAMRIFDPSLIASDFGVSMGDSLARVKEKFGEPAFILREPGGGGQNYIYPISQVGFQLSRPTPGQQPQVMSVLIFNVK